MTTQRQNGIRETEKNLWVTKRICGKPCSLTYWKDMTLCVECDIRNYIIISNRIISKYIFLVVIKRS